MTHNYVITVNTYAEDTKQHYSLVLLVDIICTLTTIKLLCYLYEYILVNLLKFSLVLIHRNNVYRLLT